MTPAAVGTGSITTISSAARKNSCTQSTETKALLVAANSANLTTSGIAATKTLDADTYLHYRFTRGA